VQVYGSDERWRWQAEQYVDKAEAIERAEEMIANRLQGEAPRNGEQPAWREFFGKELTNNMAEIPEHAKAAAENATANLNKGDMNMQNAGPSVNQLADSYDTKAMEAQREQQRQNALDRKGPEPTPEPDR
jgi:hypothetical protein